MTNMRIESLTRNKRRCLADTFDKKALALFPQSQRILLEKWLKNKAQKPKWDTLLRIAIDYGGNEQIEVAESLALSLTDCGASILEQRLEHTIWKNSALIWCDYEALNSALGLTTSTARRAAFASAWSTAKHIEWQRSALADAYHSLTAMPSDQGQARLSLIIKLNDWLSEGKSGTRYQFSLFGFGQTKHEISSTDWSWLEQCVDLVECGIQRHAPALWLAGDVKLQISDRWLDIGAADDAIALTPATLDKLTTVQSGAMYYRLIENRTSFEYISRNASLKSTEIVIWLPGYAPNWWRTAVGRLLDAFPASARISCDTDPDGVQIAMQAATLWTTRGLEWEPYAMLAADAANAKHKLQMSDRDIELAHRLLKTRDVPPAMMELLQWCVKQGYKAEQENWIGDAPP